MSAPNIGEHLAKVGAATRFKPGSVGNRNGPLTSAEVAFRRELEGKHIPKASKLLTKIYEAAEGGDMKAAELFFKVCGLIRKPDDQATIQALAKQLLDGMLEEARARRESGADSTASQERTSALTTDSGKSR